MQPKTQLRAMFVATWSLLTFACFFVLLPSSQQAPAFSSAAESKWPARTKLLPYQSQGHLLVFVHPYCPCTLATLKNLQDLSIPETVTVSVVQLRNRNLESIHTPFSGISRIVEKKGWNLVLDDDGMEAKTFGATTSGECMLFSPTGSLLFAGGITASRGHSGENTGLDLLSGMIQQIGKKPPLASQMPTTPQLAKKLTSSQFPTFGCPLFSESGCRREAAACEPIAK